jgi:hypothetical protein
MRANRLIRKAGDFVQLEQTGRVVGDKRTTALGAEIKSKKVGHG